MGFPTCNPMHTTSPHHGAVEMRFYFSSLCFTFRPKKLVVSGNPTDPSFYLLTLKMYGLYIGAKIFSGSISIADWLLPHHASCPDHLSPKITTDVTKAK